MTALIQNDFSKLGMELQVVPLALRSLLDRVGRSRDYEACLLSPATADEDPDAGLERLALERSEPIANPEQKQPWAPWESRDR